MIRPMVCTIGNAGCIIGLVLLLMAQLACANDENGVKDCELLDVDNQSLSLRELRGQVVYLDFWASWCPPCLKSFPFMNELEQNYREQGLKVVAINLDEHRADADVFLRRFRAQFQVAYDTSERECATRFQVKAMPSSYLLDRQGRVRHVHLGFKSDETARLRQQINQLLAE